MFVSSANKKNVSFFEPSPDHLCTVKTKEVQEPLYSKNKGPLWDTTIDF